MRARHPLHQARDAELDRALKLLDNKIDFMSAEFWGTELPQDWRFSRIVKNQNDTQQWRDEDGKHPMSSDATNTIGARRTREVLRVIRNALAHGNIVYLNAQGFEQRDTKLQYLGFLSRYEETAEQRETAETYRLVVATEEEFLKFLKKWAAWIAGFRHDKALSQAA